MSKEIVLADDAFLVSQTDKKGKIIYANDDFCDVAGYSKEELIGLPHNLIRHPDMPKVAFKDLWDVIEEGQIWHGFVKNLTKHGDYYWVYATVAPITTLTGEAGYISCRTKPSRIEIEESETLYKRLVQEES
jgi:aerotaxis receptor